MYDIEVQSENDSRLYPAGETQGHARIRQPETWVHAAPDATSARLSQYTYGEPLRIHAAHVLNHTPAAAPGTITAHHADGLDVACADGTLRITRLQLPGKTATDAAALRHSRDLTGQQLQ